MSENKIDQKILEIEKAKNELLGLTGAISDPRDILKANSYLSGEGIRDFSGIDVKSLLTDPLEFSNSFRYKEKFSNLSFTLLKRMSKTPITEATIITRLAQVKKYLDIPKDNYSTGFEVGMRDHEKKPSREDKENIKKITDFIINCGTGHRWGRDDFEGFATKFLRDSLRYDQATFEIKQDRLGNPAEVIATDASTYRIALPNHSYLGKKADPKYLSSGYKYNPFYVQIYNEQIESEFYPWELCFGVRNYRTDLSTYGYGYSESERLVNTVTSMLYAEDYNRRAFSQGSYPKGMIKVDGKISADQLREFKKQWAAQVAGLTNAFKTPILQADKVEWIDLVRSNKDMEFMQWFYFLIKLHSAIWLIDPSELGFDIDKNSSSIISNERNSEKVKYSRDKGLTPILRFFAKKINEHIVNRIDPRYEFRFTGDDIISEDSTIDRFIKEVGSYCTIDEIRAKRDQEPLGEDKGGNLILNAQWMQWYSNKQIMQENNNQEGDFGEETDEYDPLETSGEDEIDFGEEDDNFGEEDTEKGNVFEKELFEYMETL